jgi:hypothetical protein
MIGVMASDYEGVEEVARCEKGDRGRFMEEDIRWKGGKTRDNEPASWWEADVERSGMHGKRQVDDEKGGGPRGPKGGGGRVTHGSRRKVVLEDDKTGEGPTLAKHGVAENDGSA